LANEMNDKGDVPETGPGEASTVPDTAQNKNPKNPDIAAGDVKDTVVSDVKDIAASNVKDTAASDVKNAVASKVKDTASDVKDLESAENPENPRESKDPKALGDATPNVAETRKKRDTKTSTDISATAIAASPQPMSLADILHGLISAYSPDTRAGSQTIAPAEKKEIRAESSAIDASANAQTAPAASVDLQAALALALPGLAGARPGKAESDASAAMTARATNDLTPRSIAPRAAAPAQAREKHTTGIQDIRDQTTKYTQELDARQVASSQQVVFSLPEISGAAQTGKSENPLAELAAKDLTSGLLNTSAVPVGIAAGRGGASVAADIPVYAGVNAGLSLEPRLGAAAWDNALGQKVLWMVSQQQQVAELTLNPPDLGPLQVVLTINNDQASATFVSQNADVRQALEAALPRLREMMADTGISLGNTTVSADTSQHQGGFERQHQSNPRYRESESGKAMAALTAQSTGIGMSRIHGGGSRLVDTFA
jgi:flagellar hook-length control protein FliK